MSRPVTYLSSIGFSSVASTDDDILVPIFADDAAVDLPTDAPLSFYFSASSICPSIRGPHSSLAPSDSGLFSALAAMSQASIADYDGEGGWEGGDARGVVTYGCVEGEDTAQHGMEETEVVKDEQEDAIDDLAVDDGETDLAHAVALGSTAAYHESLLDQHRQLTTPEPLEVRPSTSRATNNFLLTARYWIQLPKSRITSRNTDTTTTETARPRSKMGLREPKTAPATPSPLPDVSQQDLEQFEALPVAIRRKFFSTSERLRFAQSSSHPEDYEEILDFASNSALDNNPSQKPPQPEQVEDVGISHRLSPTEPLTTEDRPHPDCFFLAKLPPKIREKHLTREEQILLVKALRESVILDAARELQDKLRLPDSQPHLELHNKGNDIPTLSSTRSSMDSAVDTMDSRRRPTKFEDPQEALIDSFRWLDDDENLDLRLVLDNYPNSYKDDQPLPKKDQGASFRRHLSLTKMSFNRSSSLYSTHPTGRDTTSPPTAPNTTSTSMPTRENNRKSKGLSLITPRHGPQQSVASIDPDAAHYQDPGTRTKLRNLVASPQKFDEAIEYGFPSQDDSSVEIHRDEAQHTRCHTRQKPSDDSERFKTFFADDQSSTYSEDVSMADSESPRTPHTPDQSPTKSMPPSSHSEDSTRKVSGHFPQAPASSREMTLRMTLTRPDLRACESDIYGWQRGSSRQSGRASQASRGRYESPPPPAHKYASKDSIDRVFADIDQELNETQDRGVMKRMWKRVRRV